MTSFFRLLGQYRSRQKNSKRRMYGMAFFATSLHISPLALPVNLSVAKLSVPVLDTQSTIFLAIFEIINWGFSEKLIFNYKVAQLSYEEFYKNFDDFANIWLSIEYALLLSQTEVSTLKILKTATGLFSLSLPPFSLFFSTRLPV